ncbi:MAG: hypothetical protein U0Q16_05885 [Bryobacteraceae bacterium]
MSFEILVREQIDIGRRLVERVRHTQLFVVAVYWHNDESFGGWRLILISPDAATKGRGWAEAQLRSAMLGPENEAALLAGTSIEPGFLHDLYYSTFIYGTNDRVYRGLLRLLASFGRPELRNVRRDDAYIYELSAAPEPVAG